MEWSLWDSWSTFHDEQEDPYELINWKQQPHKPVEQWQPLVRLLDWQQHPCKLMKQQQLLDGPFNWWQHPHELLAQQQYSCEPMEQQQQPCELLIWQKWHYCLLCFFSMPPLGTMMIFIFGVMTIPNASDIGRRRLVMPIGQMVVV